MEKKNPIPLPKNPNDPVSQFEAFIELVRILRAECPWDRKQTHATIAPLMIEEVYECADAIYGEDDTEFSKELGDLLLHIVLQSRIAEQRGAFDMRDVIERIAQKMIHRHPHVFGDKEVESADEVMSNWEQLKMQEKRGAEKIKSILDGVPKALPALLRAERIQHKASRVGFDWEDKNNVWDKVYEELGELRDELESGNMEKARGEFGDFLFALVNTARHYEIVPEEALQRTNNKFTHRFQFIEARAKELGKDLNDMSLEEMDAIWDEAKLAGK